MSDHDPSPHEQTSLLSTRSTPTTRHHNLAGLSPLHFRLTCLSLWSITFLVSLDSTIIATLLTPISSSFNASNQSSWLGTSYLLSLCCFTPIYGRLSDALGRRAAYFIGMGFFGVGTLICGVAGGMGGLILGRGIAGVGGGGLQSVNTIIMSDLVDLRHRGLFQGYSNIWFGLGGALGGPVGGLIADTLGWRAAFLIQIPLLALSSIIFYTQVHLPDVQTLSPGDGAALPVDSKGTAGPTWRSKLRRIDYLGSLTLVLAVGSLLLSLSFKTSSTKSSGEDYAWTDPLIWLLLLGSLISTIAFILVESKIAIEPILPLSLLSRRTPFFIALTNFLMPLSQFSILYNIPLFFTTVKQTTSSQAGARLLPYSGMIGVGSLVVGWYIRRTGRYGVVGVGSAVLMVGSLVGIARWGEGLKGWKGWVWQVPGGFGYAGVLTSTLVGLMADVNREGMGETAVATSMTYLFRTTGQVLGVSISSAITQSILSKDLPRLITGEDAEKLIYTIRHSTSAIRDLPPSAQQAARTAYQHALHVVFLFDLVLTVLTVLSALGIREINMDEKGAVESRENED